MLFQFRKGCSLNVLISIFSWAWNFCIKVMKTVGSCHCL